MEIEIREGRLADIKEFLEIYHKVYPKDNLKKANSFFLDKIKNDEMYVAIYNGKCVGYASFMIFLSSQKKNAMGQTIIIKEKFRGKCIGKMLFKQCLLRALDDGVDEILIAVNSINKVSLRLHYSTPKMKVGGYIHEGKIKKVLFTLNCNELKREEVINW